MNTRLLASLFMAAMLMPAALAFAAEGVRVQWFGQSAFRITSADGKVIVVDPFLTQNPVALDEFRDLEAMGDVDLILVTHVHGDHWGDTAALAKKTGARVALNADFGSTIRTLGILPGEQLIRCSKSGPIQPLGDGKPSLWPVKQPSPRAGPSAGSTNPNPGKASLSGSLPGQPQGACSQEGRSPFKNAQRRGWPGRGPPEGSPREARLRRCVRLT